jgi:hypothetical protein
MSALSLISNIGTFAEVTLKLVGPANPFLWVAGKLVEVVVSATGLLARTPLVDGTTPAQANEVLNAVMSGQPGVDEKAIAAFVAIRKLYGIDVPVQRRMSATLSVCKRES